MQLLDSILLISCFLRTGSCYTNYIHLLGWTLNADTLSTYSLTNDNDCGTECATTPNCTGFQIVYGTGACNLLTMVRSVTFDSDQCVYYLKQSTNVTIEGRNLNGIDALIQNAVYDSQSSCPDGWLAENTICTLTVSENICDEYASFLNASWDDTTCIMPLMNVIYTCPSSSYTIGSYPDGHYCYIMIAKWTDSVGNTTYADKSNQYCYTNTGGYLASIHSEAENNDLFTLRKQTPGVMIGLASATKTVTSAENLYWTDGTTMDYTNFKAAISNSGNLFFFTLMLPSNGEWTVTLSATQAFKYIACKQKGDDGSYITNYLTDHIIHSVF